MPKINLNFNVYSEGFSTKIYRNEVILGDNKQRFGKKDLHAVLRFIKQCMVEFNNGNRGIRYGRNHVEVAKEKTEEVRTAKQKIKDQDPRKLRAAIKRSFQA